MTGHDPQSADTGPAVLICGAARNAAAGLPLTLARIEELRRALGRCDVVIVTNDNLDGTDDILESWRRQDGSHQLVRLDGLAERLPANVERITAARNAYLAWLQENRAGNHEFVVVLDLDGPNQHMDVGAIVDLVQGPWQDWDAVFANQRQAYYDIFALRHPQWCPGCCLSELKARTKKFLFWKLGYARARNELIYRRQYAIPPSAPPIPVQSAFGGLGIYRASTLQTARYAARDQAGNPVCEHVALHEAMLQKGARLFIVPWLLNDAPAEHLGRPSGQPFPAAFLDADSTWVRR